MIPTNSDSTMVATTSTMPSSTTSSSINLTNQPLLLLSNMSNMMIVKLDNSNYIVWKHKISTVLETYSLIELASVVAVKHIKHDDSQVGQFQLHSMEPSNLHGARDLFTD